MGSYQKLWLSRLFLGYSTMGILAFLFLYVGLDFQKVGNLIGSVFLLLGGLMGLWSLFRFFSVLTMKALVVKVEKKELSYEQLFSFEVSKNRLVKTAFHTFMSMLVFITLAKLVSQYHDEPVGWGLFLLLISATFIVSFLRASNQLQMEKMIETIELKRFTGSL
jgi:hypothetical protein